MEQGVDVLTKPFPIDELQRRAAKLLGSVNPEG